MVKTPKGEVVPFGKYKGQPVERMMADPSYCEWMSAQPWFREKFAALFAIIVNGGAAPDAETPEHNRMQALFLDGEMCLAAARSVIGDARIETMFRDAGDPRAIDAAQAAKRAAQQQMVQWRRDRLRRDIDAGKVRPTNTPWSLSDDAPLIPVEEFLSRFDDYGAGDQLNSWRWRSWPDDRDVAAEVDAARASGEDAKLTELVAASEHFAKVKERGATFEQAGWDVVLLSPWSNSVMVAIELKPLVGDDYPAVLRTMLGRTPHLTAPRALVIDRFDAEGASYHQVKRIFKASAVEVRSLAEIQAISR